MQQVEIPGVKYIVPDGYRLISLQQCNDSLLGKTWTMKELRQWLGNKSSDWIKENILFNRRYKVDIDEMIAKRQIIRSKGHGSPWLFKANVLAQWLDEHWEEFNW
ncbi:DUF771 domain-containing protein [Bombilactobacillus bombi]|uniref:DUF771 domain-containing protein n=1 Tax=Bombilactobacillus bombi TaxID=1303590 RepID=A0A3R6UXF7_9LACO|nr:DUF771 domain-containing protein [Bombilactobacillus bombi]RHW46117.1 DUF771 domain-containing protein [Bombilactobacillus bombi]RHW49702.1 DUF771 domain-containing protein [Bombilactobacillus bombi]